MHPLRPIGQGIRALWVWTRAGESSSALIIGNGSSRSGIDLNELAKPYDLTFGCNIIYRDFFPDYIITINLAIFQELIENEVWQRSGIIYKGQGSERLRDKKFNERNFYHIVNEDFMDTLRGPWVNSGHILVWLAIKMGFKIIHLVGFDLDEKNIYRGKHDKYMVDIMHEGMKERFMKQIKEHPEIYWRRVISQNKTEIIS